MAYHDELIEQAVFLSQLNLPGAPKQADLRRAVSSAYYALFHMLTAEAAQCWKHEWQRHRFARIFDHGRMKTCSVRISSRRLSGDTNLEKVALDLKLVAALFIKLQEARHSADYDNSKILGSAQVAELISEATEAMTTWAAIRNEPLAQDYLFELFGSPSR